MEHEKKLNINAILIILVVIAILLFVDSKDLFTSIELISGVNVMNWTVFLTGLIAVFGTWFVTSFRK